MTFGQLVIGPPGSGKTTYCHGMYQFMKAIGRNVVVVNLDPANDTIPYECAVNVMHLINLDDVMDRLNLGPNGGLVYCMEYLEQHLDWLKQKLAPLEASGAYVLFDLPGQVELYTHHQSLRNIIEHLKQSNYQLCTVHLVDSHHCSDASKYISVLLLSLSIMCNIELPHVNILSKVDLIEQHGTLDFNLDFYTEAHGLDHLMDRLEDSASADPFAAKHVKLSQAIVELVSDFSLVSFCTLAIMDKESVYKVIQMVDTANGYIFGDRDKFTGDAMLNVTAPAAGFAFDANQLVQERYMYDEWADPSNQSGLDEPEPDAAMTGSQQPQSSDRSAAKGGAAKKPA